MTESEWQDCPDPLRLLAEVRATASDRRLRRLACAVCRAIPELTGHAALRDALAEAERYTDGASAIAALRAAWDKVRLPPGELLVYPLGMLRRQFVDALLIPRDCLGVDGFFAWAARWMRYADLVREVFPGPGTSRPALPQAVRTWKDGLAVRLARDVVASPAEDGTLDSGRLAILADALLDAGCPDDALLEHLRSRGPHLAACWAVEHVAGEPPAPASAPGLPGYEVLHRLWYDGRGGGLAARDTRTGRLVTLKLSGGRGGDTATASRRRLRTEADVLQAVRHPHVERLYQVFEWDGHLGLAVEPLEGDGLRRVSGGWDVPVAVRTALAIARALAAVHDAGFIHGALGPPAVRSGLDGEPRLTAFGEARRAGESPDEPPVATRTFGMPPEHLRAGRRTAAHPPEDVFALGSLLYWMLTGRGPFQAPSVFETLDRLQAGRVTAPNRMRPGAIPPALEAVCLQCLRAEPAERPASGTALAAALETALEAGETPPPQAGTRSARGWRRLTHWLGHR